MITNVSVLGPSTMISIGQYNHSTRELQLWVYATRFIPENGEKFAVIQEFDTSEFKQAQKVTLVDIDWDKRYEMTYNQFKRIKLENGARKVNISKLKAL